MNAVLLIIRICIITLFTYLSLSNLIFFEKKSIIEHYLRIFVVK